MLKLVAAIVAIGGFLYYTYNYISNINKSLTDKYNNLSTQISALSQTDLKQVAVINEMVAKQINSLENIHVPGTIHAFAGSNIPTNYALCNGDTLLISEYPELFSAIGNTFNTSNTDSSLYFNLPDLRGLFIRGLDPLRTIGSIQPYSTALPKSKFYTSNNGDHTHTMNQAGQHSHNYDKSIDKLNANVLHYKLEEDDGAYVSAYTTENGIHVHTINNAGTHSHDILGGDSETRPANIALNYIICTHGK